MFQRHTTALTVSWPCSVLCRTAQVHVWGSAAGLRRERGSPAGSGADGTVSGADVDSQSSHCNAQRHTVRPRLGPVWRSPDNRTIPHLSRAALPRNTEQS
ncbi:hypothetical protein F7725_007895 [Dissostichus mawsoni]|uniref:Uncharacterized protein n=1 Tax=Dissostichus mawsoni TaxID=36200 RepID=A0A7J5Y5M9_DISMA|nr:hypothetical protein F7725_007895 [Dissostichus mawsoni]